jgi:OOP family OmpA-OmpF porin
MIHAFGSDGSFPDCQAILLIFKPPAVLRRTLDKIIVQVAVKHDPSIINGQKLYITFVNYLNKHPMKKFFFQATCFALFPVIIYAQDMEGSKDHPLFSRTPGFTITDYTYEEFGAEDFYDEHDNDITVEGEKTYIYYESVDLVAPLKIIRNYVNAAKEIGGKTVEYTGNRVYINIKKDGMEIWACVYADDYYYTLTIVERAGVKQEITASDILKDLKATGKAILYINFDSGKSIIKEESKPIVDQISEMLHNHPEINLSIEGHTDDQGDKTSNQTLSENRARAVLDAITSKGISSDRLSSKGFGEDNPIADNSMEEGRAKNRRVELIKQ